MQFSTPRWLNLNQFGTSWRVQAGPEPPQVPFWAHGWSQRGATPGLPPHIFDFCVILGFGRAPKIHRKSTFDRQGGLWMTFFGNFWCQSKYYAFLHRFWSKNRWKTALFWLRFCTAARAFWKPGKPWKSLFYLRKTMIFNNSRFPRFPFFPSKNAKNPM